MTGRTRFLRRAWELLIVGGVGLLGAAALTSCGPDDDTGTDTNTTEAPGPEESTETPVAFGDSTDLGDWTVAIGQIEFDAAELIEDYEDFNRAPAEGQTFVMVTLDITYNGEGSIETNYVFDCTLWDGNDAVGDDLRDMAVPEALDQAGPVESGSTVSGNVLFEAHVDDHDDLLLGVETGGEWRFFALV